MQRHPARQKSATIAAALLAPAELATARGGVSADSLPGMVAEGIDRLIEAGVNLYNSATSMLMGPTRNLRG